MTNEENSRNGNTHMVKMSSSKKKNGKHTHRVSEKERVQFDLCVMKCHLSTVRSVNTILLSYAYKCFHKYHSESYGRRKTGACCAKQRYKNGKKSTATETIRNSTKICVYVCVCVHVLVAFSVSFAPFHSFTLTH